MTQMKFICLTSLKVQQNKVIIVFALELEDNKELENSHLTFSLVLEEMETYARWQNMFTINIANQIKDYSLAVVFLMEQTVFPK